MTYFDEKETQSASTREAALFAALPVILAEARKSAPALDRQLTGVAMPTSRAGLAAVPVIRKSDLMKLQAEHPPFAGLTATKKFKRLLVSPGPIYDPEGLSDDWWGAGRALYAAGIRAGDVILNTFSYHLTPGAHIMESGARAVGCPVIPAGTSHFEQQMEAINAFKPVAYAGTPDFLKILFDKAGGILPIKKALVSGAAFPPSLQKELAEKGVAAYQCYATADLGIIAYESAARGGLIVNEDIILEIVRPGTNDPVADGEVGEIVVTRLNADYPLLRFGTGDLSKIIEGISPCGRTNKRIAGWMGRADQTAKVKGMFVRPEQVNEVVKRCGLEAARLIISRKGEVDAMVLNVKGKGDVAKISEMLLAITKLKGEVVFVDSLPNDGKVIEDTRPV
jgi:phenylacetate-CoA ligase